MGRTRLHAELLKEKAAMSSAGTTASKFGEDRSDQSSLGDIAHKPLVFRESLRAQPEPWTPLAAYETALAACIHATKRLWKAQEGTTHRDHTEALANYRDRVEAFERIMTKAYSLVTAEAVQSHAPSQRIGTIFSDTPPPSYEQATGLPYHTAIDAPSGIRLLKDQEQSWRSCWEALIGKQGMQNADRNTLRKLAGEITIKITGWDLKMNQVEQYLQDVENGSRKYLQDIESADVKGRSRSCTVKSQQYGGGQKKGPRDLTASNSQSDLRYQEISAKSKTAQSGLSRWLQRSFSPAIARKQPKGRPRGSEATTATQLIDIAPNSAQAHRSIARSKDSSSTEDIPFRPYKVEAVYGYERAYERRIKRNHLEFTAGQIIEVFDVRSRYWHMGRYTDIAGKTHSGYVPRFYTGMYHPEISAIMRESCHKKSRHRPHGTESNGIAEQFESLCAWLEREKQDWGLAMEASAWSISYKGRPCFHNVPAVIMRMNALEVWIGRHRDQGMVLKGMVAEMKDLRSKAKRRLLKERSLRYQRMLDEYSL